MTYRGKYDGTAKIEARFPITAPDIAPSAVTQPAISPGAVGTTELATGAVTNPKIGPTAVTSTELATDAVTNPKVATGFADGETITGAVFQTASSGQRIVVDGPADAIKFHSGDALESSPSRIVPNSGVRPSLTLITGGAIGNFASPALTVDLLGGSSATSTDAVMAITGHLTVTGTGWQTISYTANWADVGAGFQTGRYMRVGNEVTVEMYPTRSVSASGNNAIITTLATGYRPLSSRVLGDMVNSGGTYSQNQIFINSSGQITVSTSVAAGAAIPIFTTFRID